MSFEHDEIREREADGSRGGSLSYSKILNEICQEEGIELSLASMGWVRMLEKNGQRRYIVGYKFDLNSAAAGMIADDKFATFEILRRDKLPVIMHHVLYEEGNSAKHAAGRQGRKYIEGFLREYGEIVIKPNNGTKGEGVFRVKDIREAEKALPEVFHQSYSASICPFYEIRREYRAVMLDGQAQLVYAKERGEDWRFNLQHGARAELIAEGALKEKLVEIARRAAAGIGLRFCSVDIVETMGGGWLVMEVNSGVMIRKFLRQHPEERGRVKEIYREAILKMFESA